MTSVASRTTGTRSLTLAPEPSSSPRCVEQIARLRCVRSGLSPPMAYLEPSSAWRHPKGEGALKPSRRRRLEEMAAGVTMLFTTAPRRGRVSDAFAPHLTASRTAASRFAPRRPAAPSASLTSRTARLASRARCLLRRGLAALRPLRRRALPGRRRSTAGAPPRCDRRSLARQRFARARAPPLSLQRPQADPPASCGGTARCESAPTALIGPFGAPARLLGRLPTPGRRQVDPRTARLRQGDGNGLPGGPGSMLPLADVVHFLAHELPRLGGRCLPRSLVAPRSADGSSFGHARC
jgi:hypothetical protein